MGAAGLFSSPRIPHSAKLYFHHFRVLKKKSYLKAKLHSDNLQQKHLYNCRLSKCLLIQGLHFLDACTVFISERKKTNCSGYLVLKEPKKQTKDHHPPSLPSSRGKILPLSFTKTRLGEASIQGLLVSCSAPLEMPQPPAVGMNLGRLLGLFLASFTVKDVLSWGF